MSVETIRIVKERERDTERKLTEIHLAEHLQKTLFVVEQRMIDVGRQRLFDKFRQSFLFQLRLGILERLSIELMPLFPNHTIRFRRPSNNNQKKAKKKKEKGTDPK